MPGDIVYWGGKSQDYLAAFQRNQGKSNNCGEYAVAAAFNLMKDEPDAGIKSVLEAADKWTVFHSLLVGGLYGVLSFRSRRLWPGGPTAPRHQVNLARHIGKKQGIPVTAEALRGESLEGLRKVLQEPGTVALVTIGWDGDDRPRMVHPNGGMLKLKVGDIVGEIKSPFAAHVMLLAAYDPTQTNTSGNVVAPWGFINSWIDGGDRLYWMPEEDLERVWSFKIPFVRNNLVTLTF